ncbi:ABC transporter permease [Clostridium sp. A1-XYC3]|uniref:ABC transporter permease n=1 Tax=Clostridium tanneri TaxID=3037988 RepID=A0ABU4JVR6_9CLOT|nr:ABC transporter permease [Clostridium sp. A1-XYC3]MDW8802197.1 ABC transporter permease [Clostridium sp. A1-XYC3]
MFTSFKIATRFIRSSKVQTFIIILGIAIGVSVQVFIGLLSQGLEKSLLDKVTGSLVHITVNPNSGNIENWQDIKDRIKKQDEGINIVAPVAEKNAFVKVGDKKENIQVRGFVPEDINSLYDIKSKIYLGSMVSENEQTILGKDLKKKLGVNVGDKIEVNTIDGKKTELTVVGFYDLGAVKINSIWVITDLKTAQDLSGSGDKISSIEISVKDSYNADIIGDRIQKLLGNNDFVVENWKGQNKFLASAMVAQKVCSVIIQFFVLLAAVLSIISILNISVIQKYKQIGILKAMGIKDGSAALIFLLQAFILGVIGTAVGILFTYMYIKGFNKYIVTSDGKPIVKILINHNFILVSAFIDIAASTLAAVFPAFKSFRLNPVEVIKNG